MVFLERTYSLMLVSASEKFNNSIMPLLPGTDYYPVHTVASVSEARRRLVHHPVDLVVINAPLKDDFGLRLAIDICSSSSVGVLLLVKNDLYDEIYVKALEHGIMTLPKPTSSQMLTQCLRGLCAIRERMRRASERQVTVEEKIEEIRLVNRAKWLLIEKANMTEADAHRYIEKQAMDRRCSKRAFAESVIAQYPAAD